MIRWRTALSLFLGAWTGFVSLSYELLWARVISFIEMGRAYAFPMTLGLFLLGVAIGARLSKKFSSKYASGSDDQLRVLSYFMIGSAIFGWMTVPIVRFFAAATPSVTIIVGLYVVCAGATLFGAQFPLLAHFWIEADGSSGKKVSLLYVMNIVGSVAGSLLTGFLFMDIFSLAELTTGLATVGIFVGAIVLVGSKTRSTVAIVAFAAVAIGTVWAMKGPMFDNLYADLLNATDNENTHSVSVKHIVESKSGVIVVTENDEIYGGGAFDGEFKVSFTDDTNNLIRPFSLAAFHEAPKRVLVIGLGSGSWAKAVSGHPGVEEIVIVEISADYVKLARHYPSFDALLNDPRVTVITDDGRRWLRGNDEMFDAVVSNTTLHWRSMASNLLSVEFFELVKEHLNPGGVFMYNTTGSIDAVHSGLEVFDDTFLVYNAVVASGSKMPFDVGRLEAVWRDYRIDGEPMIRNAEDETLLNVRLESFRKSDTTDDGLVFNRAVLEKFAEEKGGRATTDYNMGQEWMLPKTFD